MHPRSNMDFEDFTEVLKESEQVLRDCFTKFALEEVLFSFNGGKDCTLLLHLTIKVLKDMTNRNDIPNILKIVYIRTKGPFREIEAFVKEVEEHYGVRLVVLEGEMKSTLEQILKDDPGLKACLMGTRRTDPYSENLQFMQKTDSNWPQIIRVSPLLNWGYHQIWSYIHTHNVPYCSLYNHGYTSIGSILNTRPNPALAYTDECGRVTYRPAWMLAEAGEERAGRGRVNGHVEHSYINTCPILWDIGYDWVLRGRLLPGMGVICYADDTLVYARGKTYKEAFFKTRYF